MKISIKKSKIIVLVIIGFILIIIGLFTNKLFFNQEFSDDVPYMNVKYNIPIDAYCSCLSFLEDNNFSEYDCDSEPSGMPFSGEFYDYYYYNKKDNIIVFKGKNQTPIKAKILAWTDEKLEIKVLDDNLQDRACSSDGKNTYTYYVESIKKDGASLKEYINRIREDNPKIKLTLWFEGHPYNNSGEVCVNCRPTSTEDIISKIEDEKEYTVIFDRAPNGDVTGLAMMID